MRKSITDTADLKAVMLDALKGDDRHIHGIRYRELPGIMLETRVESEAFFASSRFHEFNSHLAQARVDYIDAKNAKEFDEVALHLKCNLYSRQGIIYCPDWYWLEHPRHVNCILAYQFIIDSERRLHCHVFMRSSDLFAMFPFDWYAVSRHMVTMMKKIDPNSGALSLGWIIWHISNAHVKVSDEEKIHRWLE